MYVWLCVYIIVCVLVLLLVGKCLGNKLQVDLQEENQYFYSI